MTRPLPLPVAIPTWEAQAAGGAVHVGLRLQVPGVLCRHLSTISLIDTFADHPSTWPSLPPTGLGGYTSKTAKNSASIRNYRKHSGLLKFGTSQESALCAGGFRLGVDPRLRIHLECCIYFQRLATWDNATIWRRADLFSEPGPKAR